MIRGITLCLTVSILGHVILAQQQRAKRVITGIPLMSRSGPYNVVKYYVWISSGHECDVPVPSFLSRWFGDSVSISIFDMQCQPNPQDINCSGSLVTPKIVQTACHCLATFPGPTKNARPAVLKNRWETTRKAFVGHNSVSQMRYGYLSHLYIVHQKCGKTSGVHYILYDYGWLTLLLSVNSGAAPNPGVIDFAPMYTIRELGKFWHYAYDRGLVCLHVGFGYFWLMGDGKAYPHPSEVLRHGWSGLLSYPKCYELTGRRSNFNYTRDATWACFAAIPHHSQNVGSGDSGGPTTCDNQFFATVSMTTVTYLNGKKAAIDTDAAIAFTLFENAVEYRKMFSEAAEGIGMKYADIGRPTFHPTFEKNN